MPSLGTYLLGWASNPNTEWAVAAALTGAAISGRMPVPIPPGIPLGAGLTMPALTPASSEAARVDMPSGGT